MSQRDDDRTARSRPRDRGQATLWAVGLCVVLLGFGGISLDMWRAFTAWRSLAAAADASAAAGASGIDEATFRSSGGETLVLDPVLARRRAEANLAAQADRGDVTAYVADATAHGVTVTVHGRVEFALLHVLPGRDSVDMTVTASAHPQPSS